MLVLFWKLLGIKIDTFLDEHRNEIAVTGNFSTKKYQYHLQKLKFPELFGKVRLGIAVVHTDLFRDVYGVQCVKTVPHSITIIPGHPRVFGFLSQPPSSIY